MMSSEQIRTVSISGMDIALRRGSVKRMHLRVRRDGSVYVSAPYRASMKDIERFVTDNRDWIERTVKRVTEADHGYADGETVPVLGEEYVLHIITSPVQGHLT